MIQWKNKSIDELSKKDLQAALAESVTHMMQGSVAQSSDSVAFAFMFGIFSSSAVFALILLFISMTN